MGRTMGLEPTTFGTTTRRSNLLSYVRRKTEVIIAEARAFYNSFSCVSKSRTAKPRWLTASFWGPVISA